MKRHAKKIGIFTCIALIIAAGFFDLIQFLLDLVVAGLIADTILALLFFIPLNLWLLLTGRLNGKVAANSLIAFIIGLIPVINALPECLYAVVMIIIFNNLKEILQVVTKMAPYMKTAAKFVPPLQAPVKTIEVVQKIDKATGGNIAKKIAKETQTGDQTLDFKSFDGSTQAQNYTNGVANQVLVIKKKGGLTENTLDLQNKMQSAADRPSGNLPQISNRKGVTIEGANEKRPIA